MFINSCVYIDKNFHSKSESGLMLIIIPSGLQVHNHSNTIFLVGVKLSPTCVCAMSRDYIRGNMAGGKQNWSIGKTKKKKAPLTDTQKDVRGTKSEGAKDVQTRQRLFTTQVEVGLEHIEKNKIKITLIDTDNYQKISKHIFYL